MPSTSLVARARIAGCVLLLGTGVLGAAPAAHAQGYTFTSLNRPGSGSTWAYGINDAGQIVGTSSGGAFMYAGGTFTSISNPLWQSHTPRGINDAGQIVGTASVQLIGVNSSWGYLYAGGTFTSLDVPGAFVTSAWGINDVGQVVGFYEDGTGTHGFLATPTTVPEPGTFALMVAGLAVLGGVAWRRQRGAVPRSRPGW